MNVIVDVRGMNVNIRVGDELTEDFCEQSGDREFPKVNLLSAKGGLPYQPGATPQDAEDQKAEALKARFISGVSSVIIRECPNRSVKSSSTFIFSTKDREPWLDSGVRPRVHAYLATVCRGLGAEVVRVSGVADHVHIVTTLPRTLSQAQIVE
jgi:transposase IS200 family protein